MKIGLWAAFVACPAVAQAGTLTEWQSAFLSGSQRLAFYSTMQDRPQGADNFLKSFLRLSGFAHRTSEGPKKLALKASLQPLVGYDTNLNNGIPGSEFEIGGLRLEVKEEAVAKSGFTVGASAGLRSAFSIAPRQVVKLTATVSYEFAPEHDLEKFALTGQACLQSHVARWTWMDSCLGYRMLDKSTRIEEPYFSIGGSQMFSSALGDHELKFHAERAFRIDYAKTTARFGVLSAIEGIGAVYAGVNWGERISGRHTSLRGLTASFTRPVFGETTNFILSYQQSGGGTHFGLPRTDETYKIAVKRPVSEYLSVTLGYRVNASNVDLYDQGEAILGLDLKSWRF